MRWHSELAVLQLWNLSSGQWNVCTHQPHTGPAYLSLQAMTAACAAAMHCATECRNASASSAGTSFSECSATAGCRVMRFNLPAVIHMIC